MYQNTFIYGDLIILLGCLQSFKIGLNQNIGTKYMQNPEEVKSVSVCGRWSFGPFLILTSNLDMNSVSEYKDRTVEKTFFPFSFILTWAKIFLLFYSLSLWQLFCWEVTHYSSPWRKLKTSYLAVSALQHILDTELCHTVLKEEL